MVRLRPYNWGPQQSKENRVPFPCIRSPRLRPQPLARKMSTRRRPRGCAPLDFEHLFRGHSEVVPRHRDLQDGLEKLRAISKHAREIALFEHEQVAVGTSANRG